MKLHMHSMRKSVPFAASAGLIAIALIVAGCSMFTAGTGTTVTNSVKAPVPFSITDAPSDQVIATSLTLNTVVLKDATGATASLLTKPLTFEATHLDAVQEPLFTPSVPEDTYVSVTLTYSNPQVAYIDSMTKQLVQTTATLANTSQTITFPTPITVSKKSTALLIDYLVADSVTISGSSVTVSPDFKVAEVHIRSHPGNGTEGLQCGTKGTVTALGTNNFTLTNTEGTSLVIDVDANTKYEGLSGFSALTVGTLVEVDTETQTDGSLLASRVEEEEQAEAARTLLVGPITSVTGSPATSFTQIVRQAIGSTSTSLVQTDTITITSATKFRLPGRFDDLDDGSSPFADAFSAATLFPGQNVAVATESVSNNTATAVSIRLAPQTVGGTIASITTPQDGGRTVYSLTLDPAGWLAILTGQTTVAVYTNGHLQEINKTALAVGDTARFNGFLFKVNGVLTLFADVEADGEGHAIGLQ
jgi:Domain of unknown function (DUF5666)